MGLNNFLARVGIGDGDPLKRADRPRWAAARTLQDLADLTVEWLTGRIESQPGYYGPVDVDEAPYLLDALIACNRAGFLTNDSQQGFDGVGYDRADWQQYAAVTGFADHGTARALESALRGTRFVVLTCTSRDSQRSMPGVFVTTREGQGFTRYGHPRPGSDIEFGFDGCSHAAVTEVVDAVQVTVYDPEPGSNDLWPVLLNAFGGAR